MILVLRSFAGLIDIGFTGLFAVLWFYLFQHVIGMELPPRYWNYWDYLVDILNSHPEFLWLALGSVFLGAMVYLIAGIFLRGSLGMFVTGLEIFPLNRNFKSYLRLVLRFFLFIMGILFAGASLSGIIWTGGRLGPHDWLTRVAVRRRERPKSRHEGDL